MDLKVYYSHKPFWRAEVLRVSLFIGEIAFEDVRITMEEFVEVILTGKLRKSITIPFHQLPVLEIDGEIIGQTAGIARYCGKLSNLYPKDDLLASKVDQIIDTATDITNLVSPTVREKDKNIKRKEFTVLDARSKNRFLGLAPEPRLGIKSGSIEGSSCLPLSELINSKDNTFLDMAKLKEKFNKIGIESNETVMSCGSSISASSLALAYSLINDEYSPKIYIGSWTEYGKK